MDITHQLATLRAQPPGEVLKTANRYLPPVVTLVLLAAVAYLAAQLTWRLVPSPADAAPLPPIVAPAKGGGTGGGVDASRIVNRHPFGIATPAETKPETRVTDAPPTTQPLKLTGITCNVVEDGVCFAQISTNGRESKYYVIGDLIKDVNGVRIVEIHAEEREVLLNVNGRVEKLTFCSGSNQQGRTGACQPVNAVALQQRSSVPATQVPTTSVPTPAPRQTNPSDPRQLIQANAQRLANIVRPSAYNQDGVAGVKLSAGQDRETFEALGFRDNDVVLNLNGAPLANPQDGVKILDALADTNTATVTVLRDGTQHTITLDTTRVRSILENRE